MVICMDVDGVKICHLGDLGHRLSSQELAQLGKVNVLMVPVGGFYTIDAKAATEIIENIKPNVVIPMHFRNERTPTSPISGVDEFLKGKKNFTMVAGSEIEFVAGKLPAATQIMVLKPAL